MKVLIHKPAQASVNMQYIILCLCALAILPIFCNSRMHCNKNEFYSHHMKSCVSCPLGEFFHRETQLCKPCSVCPINTISRRQCYGDEDTFCGAFIEFNKFHQSSKNKHLEDSRPVLNEQTTRGSEETVDGHIKLVADGPWYTVAMSLLGVLCFVSVFLAVYVILVCFVCKKKRQEKEIIYDPGELTVKS